MKKIDIILLKKYPEVAKNVKIEVSGMDLLTLAQEAATRAANDVREVIKTEKKQDELLSRYQVAELLSVTLVTLWHWEKKEILVPLKIGSKVRYRRSDVEKAMTRGGLAK